MSTKCSIVFLEDDTHIYSDCFDRDDDVYVEIIAPRSIDVACNEHGRSLTVCLPRTRLLAIAKAFVVSQKKKP